MFKRLVRVFSLVLVVSLLLAVVPSVSLAEKQPEKNAKGCWGTTQRMYYVNGTAGYCDIPIRCDSSFTALNSYTRYYFNPYYPESKGYTCYKWITRMYPLNNNTLRIYFDANTWTGQRKCTIYVRCNAHGNSKSIDIIQKRDPNLKVPYINWIKCNKAYVKRGETFTLEVNASYVKKMFYNLTENKYDGLCASNPTPSYFSGTGQYARRTCRVSYNAKIGLHTIEVEASNSQKLNDTWARRYLRKYYIYVKE